MNFASDNVYGAPDEILHALVRANGGPAAPYGDDAYSARLKSRFADVFEHDVEVFPVATGTAANALSISLLAPPYRSVLAHRVAHVHTNECGASEFYTGGARVVGLPGPAGKLEASALEATLDRMLDGDEHHMQPAAVSLTQATEFGTVYDPGEIARLAEVAHARGLAVHMDGARFANALVALGCTPADMTWRVGIDVLSFGATKNGTIGAEAVVLFDRDKAEELRFRRKRAGHTASKTRFMAAQLEAYLEDDLWLRCARHANTLAARLAEGLCRIDGVRLAVPAATNQIFPVLPIAVHERLRAASAHYHVWRSDVDPDLGIDPGREVLVRLIASFEATEEQVDAFVAAAAGEGRASPRTARTG